MSSDNKPLWGFRKIFFFLGLLCGVSAIWSVADLVNPSPRFAETHPPGSADHALSMALIPVAAVLSAGYFRQWVNLRNDRYTPGTWKFGLLLLLPTLIALPFGFLFLVSWSVKSCKSLFYPRPNPAPGQTMAANSPTR